MIFRPSFPRPAPLSHSTGDLFCRQVQDGLRRTVRPTFEFSCNGDLSQVSAVLFLLGQDSQGRPHLILNKRSRHVRQAGDLCCPGGGIAPRTDVLVSKWLDLPMMPLFTWPQRHQWRRRSPSDYAKLSLLLAAALREGLEEMRLNPFGVTFLGSLPVEHLVLFQRSIYPMVVWNRRQRRFFPNWEVAEIVRIPIDALLQGKNYGCLNMTMAKTTEGIRRTAPKHFPCYIHRRRHGEELLWGATFRMTMNFLSAIFDFVPPESAKRSCIHRHVDRAYIEGTPRSTLG